MRIPPLYRKPSWQRLLAGMALGAIVSWIVFIYIFGVWQDKYSHKIESQQKEIEDLKLAKQIWQDEYKNLNKKNRDQLTIQEIKVEITNSEKYKLDTYSVFETEAAVKEDVSMMIAKDIETAYKSRELIKKVIENKTFKINDKRYKLEIKEIVFYTTLFIYLDIHYDG